MIDVSQEHAELVVTHKKWNWDTNTNVVAIQNTMNILRQLLKLHLA